MIRSIYNKDDKRYIFFTGDAKDLTSCKHLVKKNQVPNLEDYLNKIPSYMFLPSFRGIPKPEVFLHKFKNKAGNTIYYCHSGLWKTVSDWCKENDIVFDAPDQDFYRTDFNLTEQEFESYIKTWGMSLNPYPYQIHAAWLILHYRQSLSQLATRAGKTLIAYMVFRYMMEHGAHNILMIVPNTSLVKQAVSDFKDYKEFFKSETVWGGGELCAGSNVTVGTFQSLVKKADRKSKKYDPKFFQKFDVVLVDEAHTLKCESINTILNQDFMKHVKLQFGFSGSLPDENTIDSFCCHALMGPTIQDVRSKELMDGGFITPIDITQIRINHKLDNRLMKDYIECGEYLNSNSETETVTNRNGKIVKKKVTLDRDDQSFTMKEKKTLPLVLREAKKLYDDHEYMSYLVDLCKAKGSNLLLLEQMLVHRDQKRLDVMEKLLFGMEKNCIVFAHHSEYLRFLKSYFEEKFKDRPVYLIQGSTSQKKREEIINKLLHDKGAILFASYGCVGTGLTLKNIDYGIFAQSFKSQIINKQALGRGLCLANDKEKYYLYDLVDCFPTGKLKSQGVAKAKLFAREQFQVRIVDK